MYDRQDLYFYNLPFNLAWWTVLVDDISAFLGLESNVPISVQIQRWMTVASAATDWPQIMLELLAIVK